MLGDLIAGFCDEQCAVVVEEADCADLILLRHGCDGLTDELVGKPVALMTKDDKVKAIRYLSKSGALMITKSGDKIAKHFGISKYTLYSYLDNSKTGGETT